MTTTVLTVGKLWAAAGRYTASGETEIMLSNTGGGMQRWATTADDTAPTILPNQAHPLPPLTSRAMTLPDTVRLWVVGASKGTAAIEV